jgi:hypothetical protein
MSESDLCNAITTATVRASYVRSIGDAGGTDKSDNEAWAQKPHVVDWEHSKAIFCIPLF